MKKAFITVMMLLMLCMLLMTVDEIDEFGSADRPCNNYVSRKYIQDCVADTGAVNVVAGIILDYRAFDTMGEVTVIFSSVIAVLAVLGKGGDEH